MDLGRSRGDDNVPEVVAMMRQIWGRFETWSAVFVPVLATIQGLQNKSEVNSQVCVCVCVLYLNASLPTFFIVLF